MNNSGPWLWRSWLLLISEIRSSNPNNAKKIILYPPVCQIRFRKEVSKRNRGRERRVNNGNFLALLTIFFIWTELWWARCYDISRLQQSRMFFCIFSLLPAFLQLGFSTAHVHTSWLLNWISAAKRARPLNTYLVIELLPYPTHLRS